jgi:hypothetical protein
MCLPRYANGQATLLIFGFEKLDFSRVCDEATLRLYEVFEPRTASFSSKLCECFTEKTVPHSLPTDLGQIGRLG